MVVSDGEARCICVPLPVSCATAYYVFTHLRILDNGGTVHPPDKLVIYFLSFLHLMPILDREHHDSPFNGVILRILRSRWDTNHLNPGVWAKGHSQRMRMRTVGEELNSGESAQLSQLDGSNDPLCGLVSPRPPGWGEEGQLLSNRERLTTRPVCQQHEQLELLWHSYYTQLHGLFTRRSHHLRKLRPRPVSVMF